MDIVSIYKKFDDIGCLTFATIDENGYPETRIAHFFAYDDEGLYLRTMSVKPFSKQLRDTKKLSVCGLAANSKVEHDKDGMPLMEAGYSIRVNGDVREISLELIKSKGKHSEDFLLGAKDYDKYKNIVFFCLYRFKGDIYDYDFEMHNRDNKLCRQYFSFNGFQTTFKGLKINDNCILCEACLNKCSFKAISYNGTILEIDNSKCDACGDCVVVCPLGNAIDVYN